MKKFRNDPRWIDAKFSSSCNCGNMIKKGERIFYYPLTKTAMCKTCSEKADQEFREMAQDEEFLSSIK
jgi:hypothetical protein